MQSQNRKNLSPNNGLEKKYDLWQPERSKSALDSGNMEITTEVTQQQSKYVMYLKKKEKVQYQSQKNNVLIGSSTNCKYMKYEQVTHHHDIHNNHNKICPTLSQINKSGSLVQSPNKIININ